jgi:hypothetical protein
VPRSHRAGDCPQGQVGSKLPCAGHWDHLRTAFRRPDAPRSAPLIGILSPSNETETWANVWAYLSIPAVMEVLIVNGTRVDAELLRRNPDGTWPEVPERIGPADVLDLDSIGFTVPLAMLYRTTTLAMPGGNPS